MEEVDGYEYVLEVGYGATHADVVLAKAVECRSADVHDVIHLRGCVGAVIPKMGTGIAAALGSCRFIRQVKEAGFEGFLHDGIEFVLFVGIVGEVLVAPDDCAFVPFADAGSVGVVEGDGGAVAGCRGATGSRVVAGCRGATILGVFAVGKRWSRMGVVHHRCEVVNAGREVVHKAEGVADFMCRKLADSMERHFEHGWVDVRVDV